MRLPSATYWAAVTSVGRTAVHTGKLSRAVPDCAHHMHAWDSSYRCRRKDGPFLARRQERLACGEPVVIASVVSAPTDPRPLRGWLKTGKKCAGEGRDIARESCSRMQAIVNLGDRRALETTCTALQMAKKNRAVGNEPDVAKCVRGRIMRLGIP